MGLKKDIAHIYFYPASKFFLKKTNKFKKDGESKIVSMLLRVVGNCVKSCGRQSIERKNSRVTGLYIRMKTFKKQKKNCISLLPVCNPFLLFYFLSQPYAKLTIQANLPH